MLTVQAEIVLVQSADVQWEASVQAQWASSVPCLHRLEDSSAIASVRGAIEVYNQLNGRGLSIKSCSIVGERGGTA